MLTSIKITNYALISNLEIELESGFSVITGETGAGKSIILGALSLILGQRADSKSIKSGAEKCVIEAVFDLRNHGQMDVFFTENNLDVEVVDCTVRRELSMSGKSRAFINDTPVALTVLRDFTSRLIDIHSQHENLLIANPNFQLEVVDTIAGNEALMKRYTDHFEHWKQLTQRLVQLQKKAARVMEEIDFVKYQHEQLMAARLVEHEQSELEAELSLLTHMSEVKSQLEKATHLLDGDPAALPSLKEALHALQKVAMYIPHGEQLSERFQIAWIEIKDLSDEMQRYNEQLVFDAQRLNKVEGRLSELYLLQKKHRVNTLDELIAKREMYAHQLEQFHSFDDEMAQLSIQTQTAFAALQASAAELTASRVAIATNLEKSLISQLHKLGMPHVAIQINVTEQSDYLPTGNNHVQFLFSANKNRAVQPVEGIASGGEISRLMLSIKSLIAGKRALPTILLDEIDNGVSGEMAYRMSEIMSEMGRVMQVITITHLPQIASKGTHHFKVYKDNSGEYSETKICKLTENERVAEIASMLSGEATGEAAIQNARELLEKKGSL